MNQPCEPYLVTFYFLLTCARGGLHTLGHQSSICLLSSPTNIRDQPAIVWVSSQNVQQCHVQVQSSGEPPSARRAAASCVVDSRWIVIHGGFDGSRCLNDTFSLDTTTLSWSRILVPDASSASVPSPRALHSLCTIGHGVFTFGGASSNVVLSSLHLLHNAALSSGARLRHQEEARQHQSVSLECKLVLAQAALDGAERLAGRAAVEKQVTHLPVPCGFQAFPSFLVVIAVDLGVLRLRSFSNMQAIN
jgi:hypothetical protein